MAQLNQTAKPTSPDKESFDVKLEIQESIIKSENELILPDSPKSYEEPDNRLQTRPKRRTHTCGQCLKIFRYKRVLEAHTVIHKGEGPFQCIICDQKCSTQSAYEGHLLIHSEKQHKCPTCEKSFTRKSNLTTHMAVHLEEKPYECPTCKKRFNHKQMLKNHLLKHPGNLPFACDNCKDRFISKFDLQKHLVVHTGRKPFECGICQETFARRRNLNDHMKRHKGQTPYECSICQIKCINIPRLQDHFLVHTREKPYKCNSCYKRFASKSTLNRHNVVHTGQKLFKCDICRRRFLSELNFNKHMLAHAEEKQYVCGSCHKKSGKKELDSHTEKPYKCSVCGEGRSLNLKVNSKYRPEECNICSKIFRNKSNLKTHMVCHLYDEVGPPQNFVELNKVLFGTSEPTGNKLIHPNDSEDVKIEEVMIKVKLEVADETDLCLDPLAD